MNGLPNCLYPLLYPQLINRCYQCLISTVRYSFRRTYLTQMHRSVLVLKIEAQLNRLIIFIARKNNQFPCSIAIAQFFQSLRICSTNPFISNEALEVFLIKGYHWFVYQFMRITLSCPKNSANWETLRLERVVWGTGISPLAAKILGGAGCLHFHPYI